MEKITVFSQPSCGQCKMVHILLDKKKIDYEDCQDMTIMQSKGIKHTPAIEVKISTIDENGNTVEKPTVLVGKEMMNYINGVN